MDSEEQSSIKFQPEDDDMLSDLNEQFGLNKRSVMRSDLDVVLEESSGSKSDSRTLGGVDIAGLIGENNPRNRMEMEERFN